MPKALIILAEGFEDIEAITPIDLLRRAKIDVVVAGLENNQVKSGRGQIKVSTDTILKNIEQDFDCIILPGGSPGAENLAKSETVKSLIIEMNKKGKLIAAICAAPALVLAPLGILDGKKATCFKDMENHFKASTKFVNAPVIHDGHVITSRGAGTSYLFALTIIEALTDKSTRDKVAQTTLFE